MRVSTNSAGSNESPTIKRMRRRLQKRLGEIDQYTTPDALQQMSEVIKEILAKKEQARAPLSKRKIAPAKVTKAILRLQEAVKKGYFLR